MIKYIDERCRDWAKQVVGRAEGAPVSVWVKILAGGGDGGYSGLVAVSDSAMAVEAAIVKLSDQAREVVLQQYLGRGNSTENAQALRVSKSKFYELLDWAHIEIDRNLVD